MRKRLMIVLVCAGCAFGQAVIVSRQIAGAIGDAPLGPVGITTALALPMKTVTGAPYSAQVTTERVQTLADGNRIVQTTSGNVARDSQGRVRRDEGLPGLTSTTGDAPHIVMIDDPVAQAHWTLDAQTKTAMKTLIQSRNGVATGLGVPPPPGAMTRTWFYSSGGASGMAGGDIHVATADAASKEVSASETDLGTQTMGGVSAQGKRITRTIPAGQIGNEQPIVITTETWYSPDLKVIVMSKSDDPRMGETSYTLTNIQRSEPAASLFQVPDDYTVKDQPAVSVFQEPKKTQ